MARRSTLDPAERLLRDLCRALEAEHAGRPNRWATVGALHKRLPRLTLEQLDAAINAAVGRGWISAGGKPAHSVLLMPEGRAATSEAG